MILDLVKSNDPILRQKCEPFDFENPPTDPFKLAEDLAETMIANKGVGLSACQVGLPYRVFVVGDYTQPDDIVAMFNPRIVDYQGDEVLIEEGCLSFPGLFIKIKRHESIRMRYASPNGVIDTKIFDQIPARIIQHEYDHMEGILFQKRANAYHLDYAKRQKKKLDKLRQKNMKRGKAYA